jgi:hypothetical protein
MCEIFFYPSLPKKNSIQKKVMSSEVALEVYDLALVLICTGSVLMKQELLRGHQISKSAVTVSFAANFLGLVSNFLTYLLRHSQVLFAVILTCSDMTTLVWGLSRKKKTATIAVGAAVLALLCYFHVTRTLFFFGQFCGYLSCVINLFLVGLELSVCSGYQSVMGDSPTSKKFLFASLASHYVYFLMVLQEGEALYSSHVEFMRWYGNTVAVIALDLLRLGNHNNLRIRPQEI